MDDLQTESFDCQKLLVPNFHKTRIIIQEIVHQEVERSHII